MALFVVCDLVKASYFRTSPSLQNGLIAAHSGAQELFLAALPVPGNDVGGPRGVGRVQGDAGAQVQHQSNPPVLVDGADRKLLQDCQRALGADSIDNILPKILHSWVGFLVVFCQLNCHPGR